MYIYICIFPCFLLTPRKSCCQVLAVTSVSADMELFEASEEAMALSIVGFRV